VLNETPPASFIAGAIIKAGVFRFCEERPQVSVDTLHRLMYNQENNKNSVVSQKSQQHHRGALSLIAVCF